MQISSKSIDRSGVKTTRVVRIEITWRTIGLFLAMIAGIWLLGQLTTVFMVVLVALIMVGTFEPVVAWLEHRGLRRGRALALVFFAAALAFITVLLLMMPPLISQFLDLIGDLPKDREWLLQALHGYTWARPLEATIKDFPIDDAGATAAKAMLGHSTQLLAIIGYGISTLFLAIYLLADPVRSKGLAYAIVPRHHHVKLARILLELEVIVGGYMRGQLITSLAISLFAFVLLSTFGAEHALAIALFAALTDIIPFVGGYVASTPVVIAVLPNGVTVTLIVLGLMVLYQEFESRILVPRVYNQVLRLPPAIVLLALLIGGTLAGILGALLALPITAGLRMLVRELHVDLPGEHPPHDEEKARDERASEVYEQLTEGVAAADAGIIADSIAKQTDPIDACPPTPPP